MELPVFSSLSSIEKELPYKLYGAGHYYPQGETDRPFGFPVYQIILGVQGHGVLEVHDHSFSIMPGQAAVLYPDEAHHYYPKSDSWLISWVSFGGYQLKGLLSKMNIPGTGVFDVEHSQRFDSKVKQAVELLTEQTTASRLESSVLVYSIVLDTYYLFHKREDLRYRDSSGILAPAMKIILNEYSRSISLEELASSCSMSVQYFCRLFKEKTGYRPSEYINSIRITRSVELLMNHPDMKIQDITERTGFKSESYFCSVFKQLKGVPPGQFRKKHLRNEMM